MAGSQRWLVCGCALRSEINQSINQSIKFIPHKFQSSTTYPRHQGSNVERGKLKCNTYKTLSPIINYS